MLPVAVANGLSRLSSPGSSDGGESTGLGVSFPNASGGPPLQPQNRHSRMLNPNQANAAPKKEACPRAFIDFSPIRLPANRGPVAMKIGTPAKKTTDRYLLQWGFRSDAGQPCHAHWQHLASCHSYFAIRPWRSR